MADLNKLEDNSETISWAAAISGVVMLISAAVCGMMVIPPVAQLWWIPLLVNIASSWGWVFLRVVEGRKAFYTDWGDPSNNFPFNLFAVAGGIPILTGIAALDGIGWTFGQLMRFQPKVWLLRKWWQFKGLFRRKTCIERTIDRINHSIQRLKRGIERAKTGIAVHSGIKGHAGVVAKLKREISEAQKAIALDEDTIVQLLDLEPEECADLELALISELDSAEDEAGTLHEEIVEMIAGIKRDRQSRREAAAELAEATTLIESETDPVEVGTGSV